MTVDEKKIFFQEDFLRYRNREFNKNKAVSFFQKLFLVISNPGLFAIINHRFGMWVGLKNGTSESKLSSIALKLIYNLGKKISIIWGKIAIQDFIPIGSGFYISGSSG